MKKIKIKGKIVRLVRLSWKDVIWQEDVSCTDKCYIPVGELLQQWLMMRCKVCT